MSKTSSQVRLLDLNAKIQEIEEEQKNIELQKLELSALSGRTYANYLDSIDNCKFQYKTISATGTVIYRDATLNSMENGILEDIKGEVSNKTVFLKDKNLNKIYITPEIAKTLGIKSTGCSCDDMDKFIENETGCCKIKTPVYETITVTNSDKITSFVSVKNIIKEPEEGDVNYIYHPVKNEEGGINFEILDSYAKFDNTHSSVNNSIYIIKESSDLNDIISAGTCQITSAEGLKQLEKLSHESSFLTANIKIILSADIDMSDYLNWAGIRNFRGTFDGNGYVISNLNGIQGLFANTISAVIKNVGLENITVKGRLSYTGGLIGYAKTTTVLNCYTTGSVMSETSSLIKNLAGIDKAVYSCGTGGLIGLSYVGEGAEINYKNVYSSANVKGSDGVGGLIGSSMMSDKKACLVIKNAYSIGTVTGKNGIGGFAGTMYNNGTKVEDYTNLCNCYTGGNIIGTNDVGGFFGAYLYSCDMENSVCRVENCNASGKVTGFGKNIGGFAGHLYIKLSSISLNDTNCRINFEKCGCSNTKKNLNTYGIITDEKNSEITNLNSQEKISINEFVVKKGAKLEIKRICYAGSIPSINDDGSGAFMSNIVGLFEKSDYINEGTKEKILPKISKFLKSFENTNENNQKLWHLNNAICNYLLKDENSDLCEKLYNDIMFETSVNTANFQKGVAFNGKITRGVGRQWSRTPVKNIKKGTVKIPSIKTIADEIYLSMRINNIVVTKKDVLGYLKQYDKNNLSDKISLANINDKLSNNIKLDLLYKSIINKDYKYFDDTKWWDTSKWEIIVDETDKEVKYKYEVKSENGIIKYNECWDTNDLEISKAISKWLIINKCFEIVSEENSRSSAWYSNIINKESVDIVTLKPQNFEKLFGYSVDDINNLSKEDFEILLGIKYTKSLTEAHLSKVHDVNIVKKAEALYEHNMRMFDMQEQNYNMQIRQLEAEKASLLEELGDIKFTIDDKLKKPLKLLSFL